MPFQRDHGMMCLFVPLKLGAGISAIVVWAHSLICMVALLTGDIRLKASGFNPDFEHLSPMPGALGFIFGFVGVLGVYDDKAELLWWFNRYVALKLVAIPVLCAADFWALDRCEDFENNEQIGSALKAVADAEICPWARWAFILGTAIELLTWAYLLWMCCQYERQIKNLPPYEIGFGDMTSDVYSRRAFYNVPDSRRAMAPVAHEMDDPFGRYNAGRDDAVGSGSSLSSSNLRATVAPATPCSLAAEPPLPPPVEPPDTFRSW